jgi:DNA relaxase NicK
MPLIDQWRFCRGLDFKFGFKASRIDIAIDDFDKKLSLQKCIDAIENNSYSRVQKAMQISEKMRDNKFITTLYMGSRESGKMARIYDTNQKHCMDAIRYEVEFKRRYATHIWEQVVAYIQDSRDCLETDNEKLDNIIGTKLSRKSDDIIERELSVILGGYAVGAVDFVDRSRQYSNGSLENCERLSWWQEFIDRIGEAKRIVIPKSDKSVERRLAWLEKQVMKTLLIFSKAIGKYNMTIWLRERMEAQENRLRDEDEWWIKNIGIWYTEWRASTIDKKTLPLS